MNMMHWRDVTEKFLFSWGAEKKVKQAVPACMCLLNHQTLRAK